MQFGISSIAAVLERNGHEVQLLVLGSNIAGKKNRALTSQVVSSFNPVLICFTAVASQYEFIKDIAGYIKRSWVDKFLLIGGAHASLNPAEVIVAEFDALCIGEGEYPTLELVESLVRGVVPKGIANLWIKKNDGTIEKSLPRPFLDNLDMLPFPCRTMWDPWVRRTKANSLSILVGRGCPFQCSYCSNHALLKLASGRYVRVRSAENVIAEIALLRNMRPLVSQIYLEVESIALDKGWLLDFCGKLSKFNESIGEVLSYGTNFRVAKNSVDEDIFKALGNAGFRFINIGLESGSERVRREVLDRNYTTDDFVAAVSLARKYGMNVNIFNMIGVPGETYQDHLETVRVNRLCQPDQHHTSIFFPYPGTVLHALCRKDGLLSDSLDSRLERRRAVLDLPGFSRRQIQSAFTWFDYRVYKGYRPTWLLLRKVIMGKLWSQPLIATCLRAVAHRFRREY